MILFVNLPVYFAVLTASCVVAGFLAFKFYQKKIKRNVTRVRRLPANTTAGVRRRGPTNLAYRRPAARMRTSEVSDTDTAEPREVEDTDVIGADGSSETDVTKKKVGTKKAAKMAEKERRKEEREADERYREHQRKLEDQEIAKRKKAEEEEELAAQKLAATEAKQREEEEAREQAEYEKLKQTFVIEAQGTDVIQPGTKAEQELNDQLIAAIKQAKIIPIEHLALDFSLKTEACVDKLKKLLTSGQLTGLLDDRGKFVYITSDEYENVAQFIDRRGRVTLAELVENGHRLLHMDGLDR